MTDRNRRAVLDEHHARHHRDVVGMYRLTICVTPDDRATLGRMAARYDITISGVVRRLLRDADAAQSSAATLDALEADVRETLRLTQERSREP